MRVEVSRSIFLAGSICSYGTSVIFKKISKLVNFNTDLNCLSWMELSRLLYHWNLSNMSMKFFIFLPKISRLAFTLTFDRRRTFFLNLQNYFWDLDWKNFHTKSISKSLKNVQRFQMLYSRVQMLDFSYLSLFLTCAFRERQESFSWILFLQSNHKKIVSVQVQTLFGFH